MDKGKGRAIEPPTWAVGKEESNEDGPPYSMMKWIDATNARRAERGLEPLMSATSVSTSSQLNKPSDGDEALASVMSISSGAEARRLQILEQQDAMSRELALKLDREERKNVTRVQRVHSFEPPTLFGHQNEASSSLPSVASIAGAVAGFVGNRLPLFARSNDPTTKSPPSPTANGAPSSSTRNHLKKSAPSPTSDYSTAYLERLKRQVQEDQEAKSLELALRLQQEDQLSMSNVRRDYSSRLLQPLMLANELLILSFRRCKVGATD